MHSMTAFARNELRAPWGTARWELRSVNNRFLDIAPRLPEELRALEPAVRERLAARLRRGKVDCSLRIERATGSAALAIDSEIAAAVAAAATEAAKLLDPAAAVSPFELLRWPGVVRAEPMDAETIGADVLELLEQGITDLAAARGREGARIEAMLRERIDAIAAITVEVRGWLPQIIDMARERLASRVAALAVEVDGERLEQEIALLVQKSDVAEELDRLDAHVSEISDVLGARQPVGRRLDFLIQELHREANTLGSKSIDTRTTRASVDLKVLIEQMREQVQNVE